MTDKTPIILVILSVAVLLLAVCVLGGWLTLRSLQTVIWATLDTTIRNINDNVYKLLTEVRITSVNFEHMHIDDTTYIRCSKCSLAVSTLDKSMDLQAAMNFILSDIRDHKCPKPVVTP